MAASAALILRESPRYPPAWALAVAARGVSLAGPAQGRPCYLSRGPSQEGWARSCGSRFADPAGAHRTEGAPAFTVVHLRGVTVRRAAEVRTTVWAVSLFPERGVARVQAYLE